MYVKMAFGPLRIPDIHDFISDMVLLQTKNKAVSLKVANSVVHVYIDEGMSSTFIQKKDKVDRSPMNTLMSISQKRHFLADFRVIYIRYP